jgi:hypothetical protein
MNVFKSIVTNAQYLNRTFGTQNGTFYVHQVNFSDGNHGEYNSKSENQQKFIVGQEADFEVVKTDGYADKIKPYNPAYAEQQQQAPAQAAAPIPQQAAKPQITQQQAINKTVALKEAVQFASGTDSIDGILVAAEAFDNWLNGLYVKGPVNDPNNVDSDGIPF